MRAIGVIISFCCLSLLTNCESEVEDIQVRGWELLVTEKQVHELNDQNKKLSIILQRMNSNHTSLRYLTTNIVDNIEEVKNGVIEYAINETASGSTNRERMVSVRGRGSYYPRTFVFGSVQIPQRLTRLVLKSLRTYDRHPKTAGFLLADFLDELNADNTDDVIKNKMFDGLNLGQTVLLLESVQIRILMEESKYLTDQFDNAINRVIIYGPDYSKETIPQERTSIE